MGVQSPSTLPSEQTDPLQPLPTHPNRLVGGLKTLSI
jgi:hypothetical protein